VFVASGASHAAGVVPDAGATAGTTRFLREDAVWVVPTPSATNSFTFTQSTPSASWVVVHNLGFYPSVTVTDSSGNWVIGGVHHDSLNQVTLTFSAGFSGSARLI
jgi:hypothetical protein